WQCDSMKPGVTKAPLMSRSSSVPSSRSPGGTNSAMRPSRTTIVRSPGGAPVPSITVPPVSANSAIAAPGQLDHVLERMLIESEHRIAETIDARIVEAPSGVPLELFDHGGGGIAFGPRANGQRDALSVRELHIERRCSGLDPDEPGERFAFGGRRLERV